MNKLNYLLLGAAGLLLASCSQEEIVSNAKGDGDTCSVTVKLPKTARTRNVGDQFGGGLPSTVLNFAIYDASEVADDADNSILVDGNLAFVSEGVTEFPEGELETTVNLELVKGKSYKIAFFAQSEASQTAGVYTFDGENGTVTVNYGAEVSADNLADAYDCFYGMLPTGVIQAGNNLSVELTRPVAQVNWGTNDLTGNAGHDDAYGSEGQYIVTTLQTEAQNVFDIILGDVTGETNDVTIAAMAAPYQYGFPYNPEAATDGEATTPTVNPYTYIAMQYVLAPKDGGTYDLDLTVNNAGKAEPATAETVLPVGNVPLQANYQTNIFGALLTDDVTVTVVKQPNWYVPSYDVPYGTEIEDGLYYEPTLETYTITSPEGLAMYASKYGQATGNFPYSGRTVILGEDIDMGNIENYMPFNNGGATFDGQGHTISNLYVNVVDQNDGTHGNSAGLMSSAIGTVQNVNFDNCNIYGSYKAGVLAGDGLVAKISNVNVSNSTVVSTPWLMSNGVYEDGNAVAALVGYLSAESNASVENCSVTNCNVVAQRSVGGLIGSLNGTNGVVENNTVSNTNVVADLVYRSYGKTYDDALVGAIVGRIVNSSYTLSNTNTSSNCNTSIWSTTDNSNIYNEFQWNLMGTRVNEGTSYANVNFSLQSSLNFNNGAYTPIGTSTNVFRANLDGNNNTIYNLTVSGTNGVGLFGYTGYTSTGAGTLSTIKNLTISSANISGESQIGVVAGNATGTNFSGINLEGNITVSGTSFVGGLVGYSYGSFTDITVNVSGGQVSANNNGGEVMVGGVVGHPGEGSFTFSNITSNIPVSGDGYAVGGIAGVALYRNTFTSCSSSANVTLTGATTEAYGLMLGGIAGCWAGAANTQINFNQCEYTGELSTNMYPSTWDVATVNEICGISYLQQYQGELIINNQQATYTHLWPTTSDTGDTGDEGSGN